MDSVSNFASGLTDTDLAEIAFDEIKRRLSEHDQCVKTRAEYYEALTRASQLIDFATDREVNPEDFIGEIRKMLHLHQNWIERQRNRGLFPALSGTKTPVARHRTKKRK